MFALDDRTGNVITTVLLFAAVAGVAFAARTTLVVFVLALLLAYLLEPIVAWVQRLFPSRPHGRTSAIALVYCVGALLVGGAAYAVEPALAGQMRRLAAAAPDLIARLTDRRFLPQHGALVLNAAERVAQDVASAAEHAGWLLTVPIIAIFLLNNRQALIDGTIELFAQRQDRARIERTVAHIDTMLAEYIRAQLALAGLSFAFYSASTMLLGFPYPMALGLLGGALEFLPVIGWILATAVMLASGWLTHAHWIWMAGAIGFWRLVQNFVISPRIMGKHLHMEPLTVFLALMAGGQIGGLLGVLLSVPLVAVLRILWLERASRQKSAVA